MNLPILLWGEHSRSDAAEIFLLTSCRALRQFSTVFNFPDKVMFSSFGDAQAVSNQIAFKSLTEKRL